MPDAANMQTSRTLAAVNTRPHSTRGALVLLQVVGFAAATALAAQWQVRVPGLVVPITLQTLAVLLCGMFLSPARSVAAMAVYLAAGSALLALGGANVSLFTPGSLGLAGPTGGYLVGFLAAAPLISVLRRAWGAGVVGLSAAGLAGSLVIFLAGVSWLSFFVGGAGSAVQQGLLPFLPESALKLIVAVCTASGWRLARRRGVSE